MLQGRTWADIQRMAYRVSSLFHEASRLPCVIGVSWRVALDRANQRRRQVTVYFVFDGPATATHLDLLDEAMTAEQRGFGAGSIERVPANGVPALLRQSGEAFRVLERAGRDLRFRRVELVDGLVRATEVREAGATDDDRASEYPAVVGIRPPYGDVERETERMRLSFALHFATRIVEADGVVRPGEHEFMAGVFPPALLDRLGLDQESARHEYFEAAREQLAGRLGHHDKLGLISLFFSACYADGSLDAREMRVLREAGEILGLDRQAVVKYLRRFW